MNRSLLSVDKSRSNINRPLFSVKRFLLCVNWSLWCVNRFFLSVDRSLLNIGWRILSGSLATFTCRNVEKRCISCSSLACSTCTLMSLM